MNGFRFALFALAVCLTAVHCFAQGQVVFANKVGTTVDAPVFLYGSTQDGPGPNYSAQLFLYAGGSLTGLTPISSFRPRGTVGPGLTADRYWETKLVDVPVNPGTDATFVVRAWLTSSGSFETAKGSDTAWGQSDPFVVNVGGGTLPPANVVLRQHACHDCARFRFARNDCGSIGLATLQRCFALIES